MSIDGTKVLELDFQGSDALVDNSGNGNDAVLANGASIYEVNALTTDEDSSIVVDVLANDTDEDGDNLSITEIQGQDVSHGEVVNITDTDSNILGTASVVDGKILFNPSGTLQELSDGEIQDVNFEYTVSDGQGGDSTANVTVSVSGSTDVSSPVAGDVLFTEDFNDGASNWNNGSSSNNSLNIAGDSISNDTTTTTSKIYDFGSEHAGEKVIIEFDLHGYQDNYANTTDGGWEDSGVYKDEFSISVNGVEISNDSFGDGSVDIDHHYSFEATVGDDGKIELGFGFETSSTSREFADIDNLTVTAGDDWSSASSTLDDSLVDILDVPTNDAILDTGDGLDTLVSTEDMNIDLGLLSDNVSNLEVLNLETGEQNITSVHVDDVLNITDTDNLLRIDGDNADSINLNTQGDDAEWTLGDFKTDAETGTTYQEFTGEVDGQDVTLEISTDIHIDES